MSSLKQRLSEKNLSKSNQKEEETSQDLTSIKTQEKPANFQNGKNIIEHYSAGSKQDVFLEVPEYGFMMKREDNSYESVIRFNFQTLSKSFKQTGFGSYYLDSNVFLGLIAIILNGEFARREEIARDEAKTASFPKPFFEDEKPGQGDEYKYFAILPGNKEGKILVRYIQRNQKTKKQEMNVLVPFDKDVFYGKMMKIYQIMQCSFTELKK